MRKCHILSALVVAIVTISSTFAQEVGGHGASCSVNSDCQLGFVCLGGLCSCEPSFVYDRNSLVCKKICRGSREGFVRHGNFDNQYNLYKTRLSNCSFVDGPLEITNLEGEYDLGFLKDIEEVTGYLLILNVYSNYLNLTKLRIIRGKELFYYNNKSYSLYVALNHNPKNDSQGVMELQFTSLQEIVRGRVYFKNNNLLCFYNTIMWEDINPSTLPPVHYDFDSPNFKRQCPPCPTECFNPKTGNTHCWGSGPGMCQQLNHVKQVCSESCDGRCFGSGHNECCHVQCAAGCTGRARSQCLACKNFNNEGECVEYCPKINKYDQVNFKKIIDPDGRYSFGSLCVKDCPRYLVKDEEACVNRCPEGKQADSKTHVCVDCGGTCPKECPGMSEKEFLDSNNIKDFEGCTIVNKNLRILKVSFIGDDHMGTKGITVEDLKILKDIREINGYLSIQEAPEEVINLSFLSGLQAINGRFLTRGRVIQVLAMNIEYLGLTSLKSIGNGDVGIGRNPNLCYMKDLDLSILFINHNQIFKHKLNKDPALCGKYDLRGEEKKWRFGHVFKAPDL